MIDKDSLTRQIQIDLITGEPNHIIDLFNSIWDQIIIMETNVFHKHGEEIIYYINVDGKKYWIFFRDDNNYKFWINSQLCNQLASLCDLDFVGSRVIPKILIECIFNGNIKRDQIATINAENSQISNVLI